MKLVLEYQRSGTSWAPHVIFYELEKELRAKYEEIEFEYRPPKQFLEVTAYPHPATMGIVNPEAGKKTVISYIDKNRFACINNKAYGWSNIVQYIFSPDYVNVYEASVLNKTTVLKHRQFYELDNSGLTFPNPTDLFPASYTAWVPIPSAGYQHSSAIDRPRTLGFRGWLWAPREEVTRLLDDPDIHINQDRLVYDEYLDEMYSLRCGLSLNGNAEICNRDIEILAMGIPLFRPTLKNTGLYDPLIPNHHYIAFDYDRAPRISANYLGAPLNGDAKLIAASLLSRWNEVKDDCDFLDSVAKNGREWYLRNGTIEANVSIITKQLELDRLT